MKWTFRTRLVAGNMTTQPKWQVGHANEHCLSDYATLLAFATLDKATQVVLD